MIIPFYIKASKGHWCVGGKDSIHKLPPDFFLINMNRPLLVKIFFYSIKDPIIAGTASSTLKIL